MDYFLFAFRDKKKRPCRLVRQGLIPKQPYPNILNLKIWSIYIL